MRCYHFANMYLSPLQQGLQSAHVQHELAAKYLAPMPAREAETQSADEWDAAYNERAYFAEQYLEWANNHKTIIVLNGGNSKSLADIESFLAANSDYAWAAFHEDEQSLNGALTNVGVVLPEPLYRWNRVIGEFLAGDLGYVDTNSVAASQFCVDSILCIERVGARKVTIEVSEALSDGQVKVHFYSERDCELIKKLNSMRLA